MFEKYKDYGLEDFVQDDDFIQWVTIPNAQKDFFWSDFVRSYPLQSDTVKKARQVVLTMHDSTVRPHPLAMENDIWNAINTSIEKQPVKRVHPARAWLWKGAAAAVVTVISIIAWNEVVKNKTRDPAQVFAINEKSGEMQKEVYNDSHEILAVTLPDSSMVKLSPDAQLKFPLEFAGKFREVSISGEAFFDIRHNSEMPFMVYAGEIVTKVLGTSFTVNTNGENVTVSVKTGKVSVFKKRDSHLADPEISGLILKPNQKVAYSKDTEVLIKSLVAAPEPILAKEKRIDFNFVNAPVSNVFGAIEEAYGVEIIYDKEVLKDCRLFSSLANEDLFKKLEIICEAIDANYKIVDAQILIEGKKCKQP